MNDAEELEIKIDACMLANIKHGIDLNSYFRKGDMFYIQDFEDPFEVIEDSIDDLESGTTKVLVRVF